MAAVRIYLSHPLHILAERWKTDVQQEMARVDLFQPVRVIVPNRNLKRWLQMEMARKGLVAAHLRFQYVEEAIQSMLEELSEDSYPGLLRPLDLQSRILRLLKDDLASDRPRWPTLTRRGDHGNRKGQSIRLFQLARRLTDLFARYEYHAGLTMEEWRGVQGFSLDVFRDSRLTDPMNEDALYLEQRALYAAAVQGEPQTDLEKEQPSALRRYRLPSTEYARRVIEKGPAGELPTSEVYLFGLSLLSRHHVSLIQHLSEHFSLSVYLPDLAPSTFERAGEETDEGGWQSIRVTQSREEEEHPVLKWKEPFEDLLRMMDFAFGKQAQWYRRISQRSYPLDAMHRRLLGETADTSVTSLQQVFIGSCPGERREIETVFQCILQAMKEDPSLQLTDIALLITDMEKYRPYILDVFERERSYDGKPLIPYNLSDFSASRDSHFASGMRLLFQLLDGSFTRSEIFELFFNPCFHYSWKVDREVVAEWLRLVDDVNIHRYYDSEQRLHEVGESQNGERSDAFTFLRGLRRLYLGLFVEPDHPVHDGMRPHSLQLVDRSTLLTLIEVVTRLHFWQQELARPLKGNVRLEKTLQCASEFLSIPPDQSEEDYVRSQMLSELKNYHADVFDDPVILEQAVLSSLSGIAGGRGHYLAGGITICSLQPMRPVPFRHIYIAGLGEGQFPPGEDLSALDLLNAEPHHEEDRSALPRSDISAGKKARLLFFETLLSATDRAILLFNGRDTTRDRDLLPCSPLAELISFLGLEEKVERLPLKLYSSQYLKEQGFLFSNLSRDDVTILNLASGSLHEKHSTVDMIEKVIQPPPPAVDVSHLISFLKHPVETVLKRQLRLFDSRVEDDSLSDDEPFHITNEEIWDFPSLFFERALDVLPEGVEIAVEHALSSIKREFSDRLPVPPYDEVALQPYRNRQYREALEVMLPLIAEHDFGPVPLRGEDTVEIPYSGRLIQLTGVIPLVAREGEHVYLLQPGARDFQKWHVLPSLIYLYILKSLPNWSWKSFTVYLLHSKKGNVAVKEYAKNPDCDVNNRYLESLLKELLDGKLDYLPVRLKAMDALWEPEFFSDGNGHTFMGKISDELVDSDASWMDLMRLLKPEWDGDVMETLRLRWQPLVELVIPEVAEATARKKSGRSRQKKK